MVYDRRGFSTDFPTFIRPVYDQDLQKNILILNKELLWRNVSRSSKKFVRYLYQCVIESKTFLLNYGKALQLQSWFLPTTDITCLQNTASFVSI